MQLSQLEKVALISLGWRIASGRKGENPVRSMTAIAVDKIDVGYYYNISTSLLVRMYYVDTIQLTTLANVKTQIPLINFFWHRMIRAVR